VQLCVAVSRCSTAGLALAVIALAAAPAAAGGYVSLGIGQGAHLEGEMAERFSTEGSTPSGRLALGHRTGPIAIEASMFGSGLEDAGQDHTTLAFGAAAKLFVPLVSRFELYGRAGLNRTWIKSRDDDAPDLGYSGRGYDIGGGLQFSFSPFPPFDAAIWVDYTRHTVGLQRDGAASLDGSLDMVMVGITVGM
jgi:hypothetical protein